MTPSNILRLFIIGFLFLSCNSKTEVKAEKIQLPPVDKNHEGPNIHAPADLKLSAFLIYDDSSISSFDVLNDKTKALWNTIIGAGDTEKPSNSTKIKLTGQLDSLIINVFNGKKKVLDQKLPNFSGDYEFIINNTGCEIVKINVTKRAKTVIKGEIPFHCGE